MPNSLQQTPVSTEQSLALMLDAQGQVLNADSGEVLYSAAHLIAEEMRLPEPQVLWLPTELVMLHQQFVPGKRLADCTKALPFVLEAQLSLPIEEYFLVVLDKTKTTEMESSIVGIGFSVALVKHELMSLWQSTLQTLGWSKCWLIADCFRLPNLTENQVPRYLGQRPVHGHLQPFCWLRSGAFSGVAGSESWLPIFEQQAKTQSAESINFIEVNDQERLNSYVSHLPAGEKLLLKKLNLRQGEFALGGQSSVWSSGILTTAALVAGLAVFGAWQFQLQTEQMQQQAQVYQQQTKVLFQQMFPDVKRVVNIKAQTMSRLKAQAQEASDIDLIAWLAQLETLMAKVPEVKIQLLEWDGAKQTLKLQLLASSSAQIARLNDAAKQMPNFPASIVTQKVQPNQVEALLNVRQSN